MKCPIKKASIKAYEIDDESVAVYVTTVAGETYTQTHDRGDQLASARHLAQQIKCLGVIELPGDWIKL
jgi:hypothetical protein